MFVLFLSLLLVSIVSIKSQQHNSEKPQDLQDSLFPRGIHKNSARVVNSSIQSSSLKRSLSVRFACRSAQNKGNNIKNNLIYKFSVRIATLLGLSGRTTKSEMG